MYEIDWLDIVMGVMVTLLIGLLVLLAGVLVIDNIHFGESNKQEVVAVVTHKEYSSSRVEMYPVSTGKSTTMTTRVIPSRYEVMVDYKGITEVINSEELFNKVEVGESITLTLVTWYRGDKSIKKQYLTE